jgi:valyl-tRNA synthetase
LIWNNPAHRSLVLSSSYLQAYTQAWANEKLEADVKLAQDIIRASRALRADNGLPPSSKPTFFLEFHSDELRNTFRGFAPIILTLSGASEVNVLEGDAKPPSGCAVNILNENVEIHIFLKVPPPSYPATLYSSLHLHLVDDDSLKMIITDYIILFCHYH